MNINITDCTLCPRKCHIDRNNKNGYCKAPNAIKIAKYSLHYFEEPPITGKHGSGTIFFSNCNLGCIFCQNYEISHENYGKEISIEEFSNICLELQNKNASNINLVTPTMYTPWIKEGIIISRKKGLKIPVVYNTSGYETIENIKLLEGIIDIYMPDLKYKNDFFARKYSNAKNYFMYASNTIDEMLRQVGKPKYKDGLLVKGVIVRHLVLPGNTKDSKEIIKYLYDKYKDNIIISIMNQYTPMKELKYEVLNRTLSDNEYDEVVNYAYDLGVRCAFIQEGKTQSKSFIPNFKE